LGLDWSVIINVELELRLYSIFDLSLVHPDVMERSYLDIIAGVWLCSICLYRLYHHTKLAMMTLRFCSGKEVGGVEEGTLNRAGREHQETI